MAERIAGVILAGGQSSRMGVEKALMPLAGRPVIAHVIERLQPQVARLGINANGDPARFDAFGLPVIADPDASRPGPLAGVVAGLSWARAGRFALLVSSPCDTPFLPRDLVARLAAACGRSAGAVALGPAAEEPLFAVWRVDILEAVEASLRQGRFAVHALQRELGGAGLHEIGARLLDESCRESTE